VEFKKAVSFSKQNSLLSSCLCGQEKIYSLSSSKNLIMLHDLEHQDFGKDKCNSQF
jgi:hypothetical protein